VATEPAEELLRAVTDEKQTDDKPEQEQSLIDGHCISPPVSLLRFHPGHVDNGEAVPHVLLVYNDLDGPRVAERRGIVGKSAYFYRSNSVGRFKLEFGQVGPAGGAVGKAFRICCPLSLVFSRFCGVTLPLCGQGIGQGCDRFRASPQGL
jgi:hypothetical protein